MITILDTIKKGSIYIEPNFLDEILFNEFKENLKKYKFIETYQPKRAHYGNRFQAFPCYETEDLKIIDKKFCDIFTNKIKNILNIDNIKISMFLRKNLTEELKISKANTKYGFVHRDELSEFAGVFHFVQSVDGGTAFFENHWEKVPDIEIGAYSNRLIIYNGNRWHSSCTDFTFNERIALTIFINRI